MRRGDFVETVLKSAQEELEPKYDLDRVAQQVAELLSMKIEEVTAFGKSPQADIKREVSYVSGSIASLG